jgi:tetratricopeptide (TPR) repeat protein
VHPLDLLENKARDFMDADDYESAVSVFKELLTLSPNWEHGQGCYELAFSLEKLGRTQEAMEWYRVAVLQRGHYDVFWIGYGTLAAHMGNPEEALQCLLAIVKEESYFLKEVPPLLVVAARRAGWSKQKLIDEVATVGSIPDDTYIDEHWDDAPLPTDS